MNCRGSGACEIASGIPPVTREVSASGNNETDANAPGSSLRGRRADGPSSRRRGATGEMDLGVHEIHARHDLAFGLERALA